MHYIKVTKTEPTIDYAAWEGCRKIQPQTVVDAAPFNAFLRNPRLFEIISMPGNLTGLNNLMKKYGVPTGNEMHPHGSLNSPGGFVPPGVLLSPVNLHIKKGGGMSKKDFERLRATGSIVLQPLEAIDISINDNVVPIGTQRRIYSGVFRLGVTSSPLTGSRPCTPGSRATIYTNLTGLPFKRGSMETGVNMIDAQRFGSWFHYMTYSCYEGNIDSTFNMYGRPDLPGFVNYVRALTPPPNLLNNALDEINSGVYDILTELGELPETVRYLYGILRRIVQLFLGLKSREAAARKRFKGKELIDEITSLWMQFRYAVSPLAYSAQDIMALLDQKPLAYITARKREDVPFRYGGGNDSISGIVEHRIFAKARVNTTSLQGLGLNPIKTLYELTPLSFVLDWVLPLGTFLGALGTPPGVKQLVAQHSVRIRAIETVHGSSRCNLYIAKPIPARASLNIAPDVFLNWKRACDAMSLAWGSFLRQHWKS